MITPLRSAAIVLLLLTASAAAQSARDTLLKMTDVEKLTAPRRSNLTREDRRQTGAAI